MVIRGCARAALALAVAASAGGELLAQKPVYGTSFSAPAYMPGSPAGLSVDGWATAGDQSNQNSITTDGALRITSLNDPAVRGLSAAWVRQMAFDATGENAVVTYSADIRIDGPRVGSTRSDDVLSANLVAFGDGAARPSAGQMWLSANGNVYAGTSSGQFEAEAGLGVVHTLAMALNFSDRTATYYLNGQAFGTESFSPFVGAPILGGVVLGAGGPPDPNRYDVDDYAITFDNVSITAGPVGQPVSTPEPTALALAGLGLAAVAGRGLRRK